MMESNKEEVEKLRNKLVVHHTKHLKTLKGYLNRAFKPITRQLIERAIADEEELLKNLKK